MDPDTAVGADERRSRLGRETLVLVAVAIAIAILVKTLLVQAFYIPSGSMEPGLVENDRILVQKVSYRFGGSPQRGDVVVFADPGDWLPPSEDTGPANPLTQALSRVGLHPTGGHLVKRVIGIAGDTVTCCDARGRIAVNGVPLDEDDFLAPESGCDGPEIPGCHWSVGPVPSGHLFMLGDNREHSGDSAAHVCPTGDPSCLPGDEYVATDLVVGRVFALVWPLGRFTLLHRPATFAGVPPPSSDRSGRCATCDQQAVPRSTERTAPVTDAAASDAR